MEKEKDKVEIKLNSPNNSYFGGQVINGQICFFLTKKIKIRALNMKICGKGKCKWMEMFHKDFLGNVNSRQMFYTGHQLFLNKCIEVPYVPPRGVELAPGEVSMDFSYRLPIDLPSSFKGSYGSIKYKLKIVIQKPWSFDEKYTIPLTIVRNAPITPVERLNPPQPTVCQTTRNVSVFASGPISLTAELPTTLLIRNEKVSLHVTVDNRSSIHVDKLRFTIVQVTFYNCMQPFVKSKCEEVVVFTKETGGVEKKSERSFAHELLVPSCPPNENTHVIKINYKLNVEAILPAFYKNLSLSFNVRVCSGDGLLTPPGNPFEEDDGPENVNNVFICNRLSSFISTSSPTHSQLHNESESSSIYSTTSESSTATLSPAPGANDSSILSRGSTRSSLRNSMACSYPNGSRAQIDLPPLPRSSLAEQDSIPMNSSYPPPNIYTLPHYLQSSVSFEVQARYPINELPPSYEELFGRQGSNSPTAPSPETPVNS